MTLVQGIGFIVAFIVAVLLEVLVAKKGGKRGLFKAALILALLAVVLTWIVPYGYFNGSDMVTEEITRVGLDNVLQYGLLGMYYFPQLVAFVFILGGFYQVLASRPGYQKIVSWFGDKFKGKEYIFVVCISVIFAGLTSVINEYFVLLALVPFVLAILNKLKVDKISALSSTFGAILVGIAGSTISTKVSGTISSTFVDSYIWVRIIMLVVTCILLNVFTILRMRKTLGDKKFQDYELFESTETKSKGKTHVWPYIVGIVLFVITLILAYLPWGTWGVTVFTSATDWVNKFEIAGVPIFSYVFGELKAFGEWDLFKIQFVMIVATLLIKLFAKVPFDEILEDYAEGFKKMSKLAILLLAVYVILEFSVMFPVIPVIVDWIQSASKSFNICLAYLSALITSIFSVEPQYAVSLAGQYYASNFASDKDILAIVFQSAYGIVSFFAPSSIILMLGLSYLDIPYKEWMKYIWKFLVALVILVVIIVAVMMLFIL